jgi:hypothetical protein
MFFFLPLVFNNRRREDGHALPRTNVRWTGN